MGIVHLRRTFPPAGPSRTCTPRLNTHPRTFLSSGATPSVSDVFDLRRSRSLQSTLLALRSVARSGHNDAVVAQVVRFLGELPSAQGSPETLRALRAAVDDWLAHMV